MSDYTQIVYFAPKDALITGNPAKKVKGTEWDAELAAISTAILSKLDSADVASNAEAAALASTSKLLTPAGLLYAMDFGNFQTAGGFVANLPTVTPVVSDLVPIYDLSTGELANITITSLASLIVPAELSVCKASTTSRSSVTATSADPELSLAVAANAVYRFEAFIRALSTSAAPDIRTIFTGPAGYNYQVIHNGGNGGNYSEGNVGSASQISRSMDANVECNISYVGTLLTAGTAGNFTFDWAQLASDATATQVLLGSWMRLTRVA